MSKESQNKNNQQNKAAAQPLPPEHGQPTKRYLTDAEKAWIIKERLARRPVILWRYRNGKWNKRLIFMLAILIVALGASLYFITRF
jgi:hypothetical protein